MKRISLKVMAAAIICILLIGSVYAGMALNVNFKDVKDSDWYAEAVGKLSVMDIINGMNDGSFNPQGEVTRAQFVKMLVQAMGYKKIDSVSFVDMRPYQSSKPHWASVYVETALRNGVVIKSEEGDRFYPDVPITRDDMVMMICRVSRFEPSNGANPYFDLDEPNGYFTRVYEEYLVRGIPMNGKIMFNATGVTTRAQAAAIIARLVDYKADPEGFKKGMAAAEPVIETAPPYEWESPYYVHIDTIEKGYNYYLATLNKMEDDVIRVDKEVPKRLYEYKGRYAGEDITYKQAREVLFNEIEDHNEYFKRWTLAELPTPEQWSKAYVQLARECVEAYWNVDYRTIKEDTYRRSIERVVSSQWSPEKDVFEFERDKVIREGSFYTGDDLIIYNQTGISVRGVLKFKYSDPTAKIFYRKMLCDGKPLVNGQWYEVDIEVRLGRTPEMYWGPYKVFNITPINGYAGSIFNVTKVN